MTTLRIVPNEPSTLAGLVAKRIRVFLAEYGIKQVALANALDISTGTMSKWISGQQIMRLDDVENIANALGVQPGVFLNGEKPRPVDGPDGDGNVARPKGFEPLTF